MTLVTLQREADCIIVQSLHKTIAAYIAKKRKENRLSKCPYWGWLLQMSWVLFSVLLLKDEVPADPFFFFFHHCHCLTTIVELNRWWRIFTWEQCRLLEASCSPRDTTTRLLPAWLNMGTNRGWNKLCLFFFRGGMADLATSTFPGLGAACQICTVNRTSVS